MSRLRQTWISELGKQSAGTSTCTIKKICKTITQELHLEASLSKIEILARLPISVRNPPSRSWLTCRRVARKRGARQRGGTTGEARAGRQEIIAIVQLLLNLADSTLPRAPPGERSTSELRGRPLHSSRLERHDATRMMMMMMMITTTTTTTDDDGREKRRETDRCAPFRFRRDWRSALSRVPAHREILVARVDVYVRT